MTSSNPSAFGRRLAAATLLALTTLTTACSAGGGESSDSAATAGSARAASEAGGSVAEGMTASDGDAPSDVFADGVAVSALAGGPAVSTRKVIATGNVALRADDVGAARFEVQKVVDRYGGEVAEEETATDDEGEVKRSRMVLRVPTARFDDAVEALKSAADLVTASTGSEDVTTKVLDVDIRVRVQRRSIRRIALLLDRADSIRDIVAIEAQLSRRQAALASLEKQQDYLAEQTSMATITVSLQRTPEVATKKAETDDAGFLPGLVAGWGALTGFAVVVLTVTGAVLPWLVALGVLAVPGVPLLRRLRRRNREAAGAAAGAGPTV